MSGGRVGSQVRIRSTVNWAVLGLLIERPSYGYELYQRLERRYGSVLSPQISQIYAALTALERSKLIEPLPHDGARAGGDGRNGSGRGAAQRQPKVHYRATPAGARAFRRWVAEGMRRDPLHGELLQRAAGAAAAPGVDCVAAMRDLVDTFERACIEEDHRLLRAPNHAQDEPAANGDELVERLVLAARRSMLDAHFAWIEYARKEIAAFARGRAVGART